MRAEAAWAAVSPEEGVGDLPSRKDAKRRERKQEDREMRKEDGLGGTPFSGSLSRRLGVLAAFSSPPRSPA
jgi:hypothetical protein